jgi:hypothetical protein
MNILNKVQTTLDRFKDARARDAMVRIEQEREALAKREKQLLAFQSARDELLQRRAWIEPRRQHLPKLRENFSRTLERTEKEIEAFLRIGLPQENAADVIAARLFDKKAYLRSIQEFLKTDLPRAEKLLEEDAKQIEADIAAFEKKGLAGFV